ncbi:rhomboid family intramembrane serine protease [Clostridium cellulovorans]|uniref:Rhomboid family protein n=1 Tax=Clostridium cellulovorans (strain ATCC 35296 / DSM 3052 / OCM 3 / 743B) TaxID=573061 RepID=D9SMQ1_CLOC7|nr:rhomboid family intramembrane serine protease [Clostridium cellulovorans]ADL49836.1 Rhomboid family protein [Clostridium cellulovorans 743B]
MNTIINKIIHNLINNYGFVVEKYGDNVNNSDKLVLLKYLPDGIYSVIFSNAYDEASNAMFLRKYLLVKGQKFIINNIIFLESTHNYIPSSPFYNYMLIDSKAKIILYSNIAIDSLRSSVENSLFSRKHIKNNLFSSNQITSIIIFLNIVIFLYSSYINGDIFDINTLILVQLGAKVNSYIINGEFYRLLTCTFLHSGLMHIAFNMYALNNIGRLIERVYGWKKFILIYIFAGLSGSLASFLFSPYVSVGASGAIFGLFGAALIMGLKLKKYINSNFLGSLASVIVVNVIFGFSSTGIDNYGHIGGLLGGLLMGALLFNKKNALAKL